MNNEEQLILIPADSTNKNASQAVYKPLTEAPQDIIQFIRNTNIYSQGEGWKKVSKKQLINILNYINFQDDILYINFTHLKYGNFLSIKARPLPCSDNILNCEWMEKTQVIQKLNLYNFIHLHLQNDKKLVFLKPEIKSITEDGVSFSLPEIGYEATSRRMNRYPSKNIDIEFIQNGILFYGSLIDFSASFFSVEIGIEPPQSFHWVHPQYPVYLIFKKNNVVLFSGECRIIRHNNGQNTRTYVLESNAQKMSRFKSKDIRSLRHTISPSPNLRFIHPFINKTINLEVTDFSGSGFSVEEKLESSMLLLGMVIPEAFIIFLDHFKLSCKAQVVSRIMFPTEEKTTKVRCGIAILDMSIQDQAQYAGLLHQITNTKSYVCNQVDLEELWKFFFSTDFVYPKKYAAIHTNKEEFKKIYERLYLHNPNIARHFIYQEKEKILGHISMLRYYKNTWIIHHHAAIRTGYHGAGLIVLDQVGRYINDFYRLYSTHMDFVISYFRPENKFPSKVFGGFTKELLNPKGCSLDPFIYFFFPSNYTPLNNYKDIDLLKTDMEDLIELQDFYEYHSRGLLINALDLEPETSESEEIKTEYSRIGFKKERLIFSLKKKEQLQAILILNISDIGLNMSNLTNCIQIIVLDNTLPLKALYSKIRHLCSYYQEEEIPILLYPVKYAEEQSIVPEKFYHLWILNIPQAGELYLKYIEKLTHLSQVRDKKQDSGSKSLPWNH